jgi:hypothetical protein
MTAERETTMKRSIIAVTAVAVLTVAVLAVTLPGFVSGVASSLGVASGLYWLGLVP